MTENNDFNNIENDSTNSRNEKRFVVQNDANAEEINLLIDKEQMVMWSFLHHDPAVNAICDLLNEQHETIELLKKEIERLKGRYYYKNNQNNPRVTVDDIIGLVHTDEPTNSVELKKELYK